MIGLLMLGSIINYLTRSTLAVAAPTLLEDLHITTRQYSWIVGAFQGAIMLQPLCGYVLDVLGLRLGFAIFAIAWSLISMAHGARPQLAGAGRAARAAGARRGLGQPGGHEGDRGVVPGPRARPRRRRSSTSAPRSARCSRRRWWPGRSSATTGRRAFVITGALGLVWVVLWLLFYRPPDRHPRPRARGARSYIVGGPGEAPRGGGAPPVAARRSCGQRNFWGIALPRFLADPTWGTLTFWVPLYLSQVRHFDLKQIALFAWMPFLAADVGCFVRRHDQPLRCRGAASR